MLKTDHPPQLIKYHLLRICFTSRTTRKVEVCYEKNSGAGKSALSKKLGELLNLPVYHLDSLFWKPNWVSTSTKEWDRLMEELVLKQEWIIDGNFGRTMHIRLREADTIIFLDYPTHLSLYRVLKRRIQYHRKTRPDMGEGCNEKLDMQFLKWIWNYRKEKRPEVIMKLNELRASKQILIFASPTQLNEFLEKIKNENSIH